MTTRLQLHLSAKKLKNQQGFMATSDPFAVVTERGDSASNPPHVVGQTEVAFNKLSPSWARTVFLEGYRFGANFFIEVGVFDFDTDSTRKGEFELSRMDLHSQVIITENVASRQLMRNGTFPHKVMGTALFEVGQILGSRGNAASKVLQRGGIVTVHIERCKGTKGEQLLLQLHGLGLRNVQTLGRTSCPYFELYRKVEHPTGSTWISVYRSNAVPRDLNPLWTEAVLDIEAICNGELDRAMKVIVWDHRRSGNHIKMGEFETTMWGFITAKGNEEGYSLIKKGEERGTIRIVEATLIGAKDHHAEDTTASSRRPSKSTQSSVSSRNKKHHQRRPEFVDYLSGGCQFSLAVAIDFTSSNGDPREVGSPHYIHPPDSEKEWNDYEKAIYAVGSILAKYDSDQKFPVWGFGADHNGEVQHYFQCGPEPLVNGVQGIMNAYGSVFQKPLHMSYPTDFTEVIRRAAAYADQEKKDSEEEGKLSYTVLLILTAGDINNVEETKEALIDASPYPLSVVIVGIGDADFGVMQFLDEGEPTVDGRDITKFVRFADYRSTNKLTEAVLDEIPEQVVSYFLRQNILPGTLCPFDENEIEIAPADDEERTYSFLG